MKNKELRSRILSHESPSNGKRSPNELIDEIQNSGNQLPILTRRYLRILLGDMKHVMSLFLQAPIIAALIGLTFGNIVIDFAEQHASDWKQVAFLLLLFVIWCSSTNGVREIVKEKHIYRHERRYRLNAGSYLLSKFALLGMIGIVQAWIMLAVLQAITGPLPTSDSRPVVSNRDRFRNDRRANPRRFAYFPGFSGIATAEAKLNFSNFCRDLQDDGRIRETDYRLDTSRFAASRSFNPANGSGRRCNSFWRKRAGDRRKQLRRLVFSASESKLPQHLLSPTVLF